VSNFAAVKTAKRGTEVEQAILGAAEELLEEGASFVQLKVEEIAARAGIGRTGFYFYFRDKRALLMRLTDDVAEALYEQADRWWHGEGDGAEELRDILGPVVRLWLRHAPVLVAVVQTAGYDPEVRDFWRALAGRFVDATRDRIEREQAAGRAEPVPAAETAFALVWMTERACYQHADQDGGDPGTLIEALTGIWLRSVYGRLP
jgi:TetR/AcrR family transcriptional regulator, ethionamide resistance regulator